MKKSEPPTEFFDAVQIELENVHVNLRDRLSRLTAVIDELREEDKKEQQLPVQDTRQDSQVLRCAGIQNIVHFPMRTILQACPLRLVLV